VIKRRKKYEPPYKKLKLIEGEEDVLNERVGRGGEKEKEEEEAEEEKDEEEMNKVYFI